MVIITLVELKAIIIFISDTEDLTDTEGTLDDESNSIFRYAAFIAVIILN